MSKNYIMNLAKVVRRLNILTCALIIEAGLLITDLYGDENSHFIGNQRGEAGKPRF